jgi:hypothetical protein
MTHPYSTGSSSKLDTALWLLKQMYQPGIYYQKAGVICLSWFQKLVSRQTFSHAH